MHGNISYQRRVLCSPTGEYVAMPLAEMIQRGLPRGLICEAVLDVLDYLHARPDTRDPDLLADLRTLLAYSEWLQTWIDDPRLDGCVDAFLDLRTN